jgi:hypothetical protein
MAPSHLRKLELLGLTFHGPPQPNCNQLALAASLLAPQPHSCAHTHTHTHTPMYVQQHWLLSTDIVLHSRYLFVSFTSLKHLLAASVSGKVNLVPKDTIQRGLPCDP